jgi:hypothetical protein
MKRFLILASVALLAGATGAQSPSADEQQRQLETILRQVQAQQLQIADNQAKIEEKLATLTESIRVARLYSSRGGR